MKISSVETGKKETLNLADKLFAKYDIDIPMPLCERLAAFEDTPDCDTTIYWFPDNSGIRYECNGVFTCGCDGEVLKNDANSGYYEREEYPSDDDDSAIPNNEN